MAYTQLGPQTASTGAMTMPTVATPAGALVLVLASVRSETASVSSISDNGSNSWTPLASSAISTGYMVQVFGWVCTDSTSFTSLTVEFDESVACNVTAYLFPDGATTSPVDDLEVADQGPADPLPALTVTPTEATSTVVGIVAVAATSRTFTQIASGYTDGVHASANQLHARTSILESAGTSATGPQWDLTSGSQIGVALLTVAVKMSGSAPDPLSINAGADQAIYVGQNATLTAVVSGGSGGSTGTWTRISGPSATIASPTALSTSVSFSGAGTYVFRRTQNEGVESVSDDVQVTVTAAPAFVTIGTVNAATSWTPTGGSVAAVLSDTADTTFITSADSPTGQALDLTFNEISVEGGLVLRLRAEHDDASSGSVTAYLYDGDTLLSTSAATPVSATLADINIVFPAADLAGVTMPAAFRVVTEWTATA